MGFNALETHRIWREIITKDVMGFHTLLTHRIWRNLPFQVPETKVPKFANSIVASFRCMLFALQSLNFQYAIAWRKHFFQVLQT